MSGRLVVLKQCVLLLNGGEALYRVLAKHISVSSFSISCTQSLWDAVGSFLGSRAKSRQPCRAGLCGEVAVALI